jgi:chaperonin GroEL
MNVKTPKKIYFDKDVKNKIQTALTLYKNAIVSTLGPEGNCVIIDNGTTYPIVTKDGVTVSNSIAVKDKVANAAISIVKEAARKTNSLAGDGTTTSTLLACKLIEEGFNLLSSDTNDKFSSNLLEKQLKSISEKIIKILEVYAKKITTETDVKKVALISCNNDEEIASFVTKAFAGIGDYGVVTLLNSFNEKTILEFSQGLEIPTGFRSSMYINNEKEKCFEADNPCFFISNKKLTSIDKIIPLMNWAAKKQEVLIFLAPDFDEAITDLFLQNYNANNCKILGIKAPGFNNDLQSENLKDLSIVLSTPIANLKEEEIVNSDIYPAQIGRCKSIKVYSDKTIFIGISEDEEVEKHIKKLEEQIKEMEESTKKGYSAYEITKVKERLARLSGGVATIYVGGVTAAELIEKKHRYEDAVNAVKGALKEGVVPGCGVALVKAFEEYHKNKEDQKLNYAETIIRKVFREPFKQIFRNADYTENEITDMINTLDKLDDFFEGYGYFEGVVTVKNLYNIGVVDPLIVVKQEIINSISVACSILRTKCVVVDDVGDNLSIYPNDPIMEQQDHDEEAGWR